MTHQPPPRRRFNALRTAIVDTTPLRVSRQYRWLFTGQAGYQFARQVLVVAVPVQIFQLTGSSLQVGLVGLIQTLPLIVFSLIGGAAADTFDRRNVLRTMQLVMFGTCGALALNASSGGALWPIFALMAVNAGITGMEAPTRTAMIPALVARDQVASAFALNQTLNQTASVVGPALGGLLIAQFGLAPAYWIAAGASLAASMTMIPFGPMPPVSTGGRVNLAAIGESWRYLRKRPLLQQTMLIDLNAMIFGMPRALFPAIGTVILGGNAATVGLLNAAPGAGAFLAALTTGWVSKIRRQGRVVVLAVAIWGLAIIAFGLTHNLTLALVLLAVAGAGDVVSNVFRATILQLALPDEMRGRVTAFKVVISGAGPRLGDAQAGAIATITNPPFTIVSGGIASIIGTILIAWRGRALWDQRATDEPPPHQAVAPPM